MGQGSWTSRGWAAALLAAAALALVPAGAGAAFRQFRSPSANLGCAFYADAETPPEVRCDWRGANDRAIKVGETGRARRIHVTDSLLDPRAKVLAYGRTLRFHRLSCRSRRTGITCRSARSGHGFTVSVSKQRVF